MSEEVVKALATLDKITTLKDRSLKLVMQTQEMSDHDTYELMKLRGQFVHVNLCKEDAEYFYKMDDPFLVKESKKSPSQRLRAVLHVLWSSNGSEGSFDDFYIKKIESLIDFVKSKIDA